MVDDEIQFGVLHPDGTFTDERRIKQSDIRSCPHIIMVPSHYRDDGSCKCDDPDERAMMIREWEYTEADFEEVTE